MKATLLLFLPVLCLLLDSCDRRSGAGDKLSTTDSAELFFKNLRKSDYEVNEMAAAGLTVYTHKALMDSADFSIQLVHDWRKDRASVMLSFDTMSDPLLLIAGSDSIIYTGSTIENHIQCSEFLYNASVQESPVYTGHNNAEPLSVTAAFISTMKDFHRLITKR